MPTIGGAVNIPGNSIFVYNSEFINNTAFGVNANGGLGGAIAVNGSDDHIVNSKFENNHAIQGGAFYLDGDNVYIVDSNFTDNRAIQGGAGLIDGKHSYVENSIFNDNYATHNDLRFPVSNVLQNMPTEGGAIHIYGENINVNSSEFNNNRANADSDSESSTGGGAIYVEGKNATISDSKFNENSAVKGGAIFIIVNETNVMNCNFTENSAFNHNDVTKGLGGAIYLEDAHNSEIIGSTFINNAASINGGAIDWHEGCSDGQIDSCLFKDNSAGANAGAVFWFGNKGIIKNSNFTNNRANGTSVCVMGNSGDGGAIMWTGSYGTVDGCNFTDNYADNDGGAVFLRGVEGRADCTENTFENSLFKNNHAENDGGAIAWHDGANKGSIKTSTFINNDAKQDGGAVLWIGHEGSIIDSNFTKNTASNGGAVFWSGIEGKIQNSRFVSNKATEGGAVLLENCSHGDVMNLDICESYFENNTAVNDGGAIKWIDGKKVSVLSVEFVNNTAKRGGAVFYSSDSDGLISNSNFTYNEAILGGAAYIDMSDAASIEKSNFDYNNAVQGGAIYIACNKNKISESKFTHNNATYDLRVDTSNDDHKTKGGAIYIAGKENIIENSKFYNNTACATNESSRIVQDKPGLLGAHLETSGVDDDGLGGAIYIEGSDNKINSNEFDYNVARNGSAIYNDASGTSLSDGLFIKNQAWSYVLEVNATPDKINYGDDIPINVYSYIAGDNILNGIYNAKGVNDMTFNNVGYIINDDESQIRKTNEAHPVLGAQDGVLYQDSLERYQPIVVEIRDNTGKVIFNKTILSDYKGNHTFKLTGAKSLKLTQGNYILKAYHPEDRNYKYIVTANEFEVVPNVHLNITKVADGNDYGIGDEITFTINVTNNGPSNATNVTVKDSLPDGLELLEGYELTHVFDLKVNESKVITIKVKAVKEGHWTNNVSASCAENKTLVNASATVPVFNPDLKIVKKANVTSAIVGNLVNFTINVTNHGIRNATNVTISDFINTDVFSIEDYYRQNCKVNGGKFVWTIDRLSTNKSYTVWIVVKTLVNGTYNNTASVNCTEEGALKNSTADVRVYDPHFNVTKTALDEIAYNSETARFKIVVNDTGDMDLTGVFVDENIPEGLVYDRFIGSNWTKDGNKFYYDGSLGVGESAELIIVVKTTKSGNFTNVIVAGANDVDNQTANASIKVYTPSLRVREISNNPKVNVGESVSFTVVVTNDGDCTLGNVYVDNKFPNGLKYTGFEGKDWKKVGNRFVYNGELKPGESISYTLHFDTLRAGTFVPCVVAGSNLTSNASAKARSNNVTEVIDSKNDDSDDIDDGVDDDSTSEIEPMGEKQSINAVMDEKATGNPIIMLLLIILAIVPLRRRKQ